jgi:hypothetical protein
VNHTYNESGTYRIQLTTLDYAGGWAQNDTQVTILVTGPTPCTVQAPPPIIWPYILAAGVVAGIAIGIVLMRRRRRDGPSARN